MEESIKTLFIGLDVHKDTIAVAHAPDARGADVEAWGTLKPFRFNPLAVVGHLPSTG